MPNQHPKPRSWTVRFPIAQHEDESQEIVPDRDAVREALMDLESIGHREGGMFVVAPIRVPVDADETEFETIGWEFQHKFAPPVRPAVEEPPPAEPEPETVT